MKGATNMSDDKHEYTPDELDFIDRFLIEFIKSDKDRNSPSVYCFLMSDARIAALSLLAERRKIRGPSKVLNEEGAIRLERLNVLYSAACRWAGFIGPDPLADQAPIVLQRLEEQRAEMHDRSSRLANLSLAKDASDRRVRELETTLAKQQAATLHTSMSVELPTYHEIVGAIFSAADSDKVGAKADRVLALLRARLGPVLAAQKATIEVAHARIAELEKDLVEGVAAHHAQTQEAMAQRDQALDQRDEANTRIAFLESYCDDAERRGLIAGACPCPKCMGCICRFVPLLDENDCVNKENGALCKCRENRIDELEKRLADQEPKVKEWHDAIGALSAAWPNDVPYGKDNPTHAEWIHDLVAVLGDKAKEQTVEALRQARKRIGDAPGEACEYYQSIIDDELTKLDGQTKPCHCQLEAGDSPCPLHGENEE